MSKVQLQGNANGTGIFTIASPNSNTDRTLTLPDSTGTMLNSNSQLNADNMTTGTLPSARIANGSIINAQLANSYFLNAAYQWPNANGDNMNNVLTPGGYAYVAGNYSGYTNNPPGFTYGLMLVFNVGSFTTQMVFNHGTGAATGYYRTKYNAGTNNEYWMSWSAF
jgi:hypothetical protein